MYFICYIASLKHSMLLGHPYLYLTIVPSACSKSTITGPATAPAEDRSGTVQDSSRTPRGRARPPQQVLQLQTKKVLSIFFVIQNYYHHTTLRLTDPSSTLAEK